MAYAVSTKSMEIMGVVPQVIYVAGTGGGDTWTPFEYMAREFDTEANAKLWIAKHLFNPFRYKVTTKKTN